MIQNKKNVIFFSFSKINCPENTTLDELKKDYESWKLDKKYIEGNDIDFIYGMVFELCQTLAFEKSTNYDTNLEDELDFYRDKYLKLFENICSKEQLEVIEYNLTKNLYFYNKPIDLNDKPKEDL